MDNIAASSAPVRLGLADAMALAIHNNLAIQLSVAQTEEARGKALEAASDLLPRILGTASQTRVFKQNLAAQGLTSLGPFNINPIIGPYDSFDARLHLVQNIFSPDSIWSSLAAHTNTHVAVLQEKLAKEQVASAAALAYVEALRSERAVEAAQSDLDLARSLYTQARDQHKAGISTGVDVARAETRVAEQNVRRVRAQLASSNAQFRLKRILGLSLVQTVELTPTPQAVPLSLPGEEKEISLAEQERIELQLFRERLRADDQSLRAVRAQNWPSLQGMADYGYSGNLPDNSAARTGSIGAYLELPIFYGGQIHGRVTEAEGRKRESEALYQDTLQQVEEDVRVALQTLTAEVDEVNAANLGVSLAERELKMARDRYAAGVGDNIQVTSAQAALAEARDEQVDALSRYNVARINLAAALGQVQVFGF